MCVCLFLSIAIEVLECIGNSILPLVNISTILSVLWHCTIYMKLYLVVCQNANAKKE